jgi:hypothetical protein
VFFMRMIMHDWADEYCVKILRRLRDAAGPETQLIVTDNVLSYACEDPADLKEIPGATLPPAPSPLLPNYGSASLLPYLSDMNVSFLVCMWIALIQFVRFRC